MPPRDTWPKELQSLSCPEVLCLSEYIPGFHGQTMTLPQLQQIIVLLVKAKRTLADISSPYNIVHTPDGKIGLIDTEERGFRDNAALATLQDCYYSHKLAPEAKAYLEGLLYGAQNCLQDRSERKNNG